MDSKCSPPERPSRKQRDKSPTITLSNQRITNEKFGEIPPKLADGQTVKSITIPVRRKSYNKSTLEANQTELSPVHQADNETNVNKSTFKVLVKDVETIKVPYRSFKIEKSPEKEKEEIKLHKKEKDSHNKTKEIDPEQSLGKKVVTQRETKGKTEENTKQQVFVSEEKMGVTSEEVSQKPVQVIVAKPKHEFELDEDALSSILLHENIKNKHVVVVSVAGAFRKGKSFLLDFFLRYMKEKYSSTNLGKGVTDWLGPTNVPLDGFSWRGGSDRETTGIVMWSEAFIAPLPSGEKVAVLFMDTQGAFDQESTVKECATVFALSTMCSSVQIYNLSQNIQEDDLMNLQLFTEYGKLALENSISKPFQTLMFLVRDWSYPYEAMFGLEGGKQLLEKRLKISEEQHPQHQAIRRHIRECFADTCCFLFPHPGFKVSQNPAFDGRLEDIQPEFIDCLKGLVPLVLAPENLIVKEINGQKVKAKELVQYFKSYMKIYNSNELPEPKTMLVATAEANNLSAVAAAKETYHQLMEAVCGGAKPYLSTAHLDTEHMRIKDKALELFIKKPKMGGEEFSQQYKERLEEDIEEKYLAFKAHNESKNIFKAARTPAVFFVIAIICYILSGIFGLFGLYPLASTCNMVMGISLLTLVLWAYIRYSGEMREMGEQLDEVANILWDNFMKPVYQVFVEKSLEHAASQAVNIASENGKMKAS